MARILVVTKDRGPQRTIRPIVAELEARGHTVIVAAEGVSAGDWKAEGRSLVFEGSADFRTQPFAFDAARLLRDALPNIVILGSGSPINMENAVGLEARRLTRPVVTINNVWGVHERFSFDPTLMFLIDEADLAMADRHPRFAKAEKIIAGDPSLVALTIPPDLKEKVEEVRAKYGKLILVAGEGEAFVDAIHMLMLSLSSCSKNYGLILRGHPKYVREDPGKTSWELQKAVVNDMLSRTYLARGGGGCTGIVTELDNVGNGDALATFMDVTVSGSGTLLTHCARAGFGIPVAISTPWMQKNLADQVSGAYNRYPGVDLGFAVPLTEPVSDLFAHVEPKREALRAAAKQYFGRPVLTPAQMVDKILALV